MKLTKLKTTLLAGATAAGMLSIAGVSAPPASATINYHTCDSLKACGGMAALVKAAKAEGQLNTITLPLAGWANEGTIMTDFHKKYGINITDANPNGSSGDEVAAVEANEGSHGPDVVDVGLSHAAPYDKLWQPYKVATWSAIPKSLKDTDGHWYADYAGTVAIGCNTQFVKKCPTSIKQLTSPAYKNMVGINNDPNQANAAFSAVFAAALANKRLGQQHQAGHRLLPDAQERRQLRAGRRLHLDDAGRHDADHAVVGLQPVPRPAEVRWHVQDD